MGQRAIILFGGVVACCLLARAAWGDDAPAPATGLRDDASLTDVCFIDGMRGWAVGDRGTIWHTRDGGNRWQLQESGVTCRLTSVQFLDAQHGWAAGGASAPFSHVSTGVVLRTRDGGKTWTSIPQPLIGSVLRLKFVDGPRGWAICVPNGLCGSGVVTTDDGGQDWTPSPQQSPTPWSCGDFADLARGAVAGDGGAAATIERGEVRPSRYDGDLRRPAAIRLAADGHGYMVGEGGLLQTTRDGGAHWTSQSAALPEAARELHLCAIAMHGNHVWLAGSPGAIVLRSDDRGATWHALSTGMTLPIAALSFVDEERGWAVGAMGQILATTDRGQTWQAQRGAGRRAAYLALFGETADVPLEALARLSAGESYRGVVSLVARRDLEVPVEPPLTVRLREREALLLAGAGEAAVAWQFPLRQAGLARTQQGVVEDWRRATSDEQPLKQLEDHLVRQIRCWRPEIILTDSAADAESGEPLPQLIRQALTRAVKRAAEAGPAAQMPPWQVKRVVTVLHGRQRSAITLSGSQILPQLGRSLAEYAAPARGLLARNAEPTPDSIPLTVSWDESPLEEGHRDFFSGLKLPAPSDARRAPLPEAAASVEQMRRVAQRRQALQAIVTHQSNGRLNRDAWLSQIGTLTRDLDDSSAAMLLYQLGCRYCSSGQCDLAADTFAELVEKHPAQSHLTAASSLWLLHYYSSGEMTVRADREGRFPVRLARTEQPAAEDAPRSTASLIPATGDAAQSGGRPRKKKQPVAPAASEPATGPASARRQLAAQWAQRLETVSDQLAAEPRAVLPAARAFAGGETEGKSQRLVMGLMRSRPADVWWSCAAGEHWVSGPKAQRAEPPKPVWRCRRTAQKPRLDGKLDDACWRNADGAPSSAVDLKSALGDDAEWPAAVQLAYDQEFLYLAVTCRQASGAKYVAASGPRQRDADLTGQDRIAIMLDVDRDWTSYWRLMVDHRGQTAEDCWGDRTWNPAWYVAAGKEESTWTCEAAIPWSELASRPPAPGETWAAGVERIVPGVGFQSWTTPANAATVRTEGFGLLMFQ